MLEENPDDRATVSYIVERIRSDTQFTKKPNDNISELNGAKNEHATASP